MKMMRKKLFLIGIALQFAVSELASATGTKGIQDAATKALKSEGAKALKKFDGPSKMKSMEKKSRESEHDTDSGAFDLGIGLQLGSNATYGNGLVTNFDFFRFMRAQVGVGYNSTGAKAGVGGAVVLPFGRSFGLDAGGAYAHSFGVKDEVSLSARFTPDGSSQKESVDAIRKFRISPGNYYGVFIGGYFAILQNIWLDAHVVYNKYVSGHQVEFYDGVSYSKPIEATNEESVQAEFEKKAKEKLNGTGPGFTVGVQFRI